ncbi:hypothetical protein UK14_04690 [Streptomyces sp. NRRL F-4428]|nr:hypothetical protein UK14_04690 [Streptomyces sp. NRRL F-4428]
MGRGPPIPVRCRAGRITDSPNDTRTRDSAHHPDATGQGNPRPTARAGATTQVCSTSAMSRRRVRQ